MKFSAAKSAIGMPVSGWKNGSWRGRTVLWFGMLWLASIGRGEPNAWLTPQPAGQAYPAGEEDRQHAMLVHDLRQRAVFKSVAEQTYRREASIWETDRDPLDVLLRRTEVLLSHIKRLSEAPELSALTAKLATLRAEAQGIEVSNQPLRRALFDQACHIRRQIAFANPLLAEFRDILFIKRQRSCFNHMCDQYYGITQRPGGGLFVLEDAFGSGAKCRDVLAESVVERGALQGQRLAAGPRRNWSLYLDFSGNLHGEETQGGSFLSPALAYDGATILFAYVECQGGRKHLEHLDPQRGHWAPGYCYHLFKVGLDGSHLVQLTEGSFNDFDPCWLPSGRIAFISERRGGYLRCGRACPTFTLFDMEADGSDVRCVSYHETHEWSPSVAHDGRLVFTRWDYVDRNAMVTHNPWIMTPDGRDPRALQGNYAFRYSRPDMELNLRAIPGSQRYVATAAPHHGQAFGSLVVIDPRLPDDDRMSTVKRLTPDVAFPESQKGTESYGHAWPLSEDYYLCAYDPVQVAELNPGGLGLPGDPGTDYPEKPFLRNPNPKGYYGLYLVDSFGNKELIYRDPEIGCQYPIPVRSRPKPPVLSSIAQAGGKEGPAEATIGVVNVYRSLKAWPEGTKITALRVYQVLPQSLPSNSTAHTGVPIPDTASVNLARMILGTAPVEKDGSAYFVAPAKRELYFQALDENGLAVTSMRSGTQFQPGEQATCQGCHEPRGASPINNTLLAMQRAPSRLTPDVDGTQPFSYPRLVQPVLDQYCVACHRQNPLKAPSMERTLVTFKEGWRPASYFQSYLSLARPYGFASYGARGWEDPKFYRTTPGEFGARASKLYQMLAKGHYDVKLPAEELHRLTVWLDSCSLFYGVYEIEGQAAQLRGEIVQPTLQ